MNTVDIETSETQRHYTIIINRLVSDEEMDEEDLEVPNEWDMELPSGSEQWTEGQRATYLLDEFHYSVAISVLDHFEFSVMDCKGREIFEDDEG